jgi:hypothetical protein
MTHGSEEYLVFVAEVVMRQSRRHARAFGNRTYGDVKRSRRPYFGDGGCDKSLAAYGFHSKFWHENTLAGFLLTRQSIKKMATLCPWNQRRVCPMSNR